MEPFCFSMVMGKILEGMSVGESEQKMNLMNAAFAGYIEYRRIEERDFEFDKGDVSRWLSGEVRPFSAIVEFYKTKGDIAHDIQEKVFPLLTDKDKVVEELYDLLMQDKWISENKKAEVSEDYPYFNDEDKASFFERVIFLGLQMGKLLIDPKTKQPIDYSEKSPNPEDYLRNNVVPKPQKHFCGREKELQEVHSMLDSENKIFLQGVAGIGKSEFVKMYAKKYKNNYTGIIYFTYNGDLKKMITERSFVIDRETESEDIRFKRHNGFFKSLKEDVLIIIDNFDTVPAAEEFLDEMIESYSCKILFSTRSSFDENFYTSYTLKELPQTDLYNIVSKIYGKADNYKDIIMQIISEVHCHSLCVELAARLMGKGRIPPEELLKQLRADYGIMKSQRLVSLKKDGRTSSETYYGHIHKLISLAVLSEKGKYIMQNMALVPCEGINCNTFSNWLIPSEINDRIQYNTLISNEIDILIELGFIQTDGYEKIMLHPLIQEVTLDDTKPSIESCEVLIENLKTICLFRGIDFTDRNILFYTTENIIKFAENNNTELYKEFLKEAYAYIEKYGVGSVMEMILKELEKLAESNEDTAVLYDYKSAYEVFCNKNYDAALKHSLKAVNLCDKVIDTNPRLASNIYSNLGEIYRLKGRHEAAKKYFEYALKVIEMKNLPFTHDDVTLGQKYGNLLTDMEKYQEALTVFKYLANGIQSNNPNSLDFADILWDIGVVYLKTDDRNTAKHYFGAAYFIYSKLKADDEVYLKDKRNELKQIGIEIKENSKQRLENKNIL
ncbi:MAG: tetratricopeptide repeat protein [Clostridiales bacterium]|nr:tetratricopeptide repeat protein [Clostridiales bacterium]